MVSQTSVTVTGLAELRGKMLVLSLKGERRVWRNSFRDAARTTMMRGAAAKLRGWGYAKLARQLRVVSRATDVNVQVQVKAQKRSALNRMGHLLEKGTRPHEIRARINKKALSIDGRFILGKRVWHPGARARPWLAPAFEEQKEAFTEDVARRVDSEISKAQARGL